MAGSYGDSITMKNIYPQSGTSKGFTLAELLITIGIFVLLAVVISSFERNLFSYDFTAQDQLNTQIDARHVVENMVAALREAEPSANGAYTIALASTSALTFFSDPNNTGNPNEIQYYMSGTNLIQGVIAPTGSPLTYVSANETYSTVASGIQNAASTTLPIFQYYDENYAGTSSPLTQPVNPQSIRLIKITLVIDKDLLKTPRPITVTSQVEVRNLKDNL